MRYFNCFHHAQFSEGETEVRILFFEMCILTLVYKPNKSQWEEEQVEICNPLT